MSADTYTTQSLCPVCLTRLPARHTRQDNRVFLEKECPQHGSFKTLIWDGLPAIDSRYQTNTAVTPLAGWNSPQRGCPFDCGLCQEHHQYGCIVLLEITQRCNLNCPVCFAGAGPDSTADPSMDQIKQMFQLAKNSGPNPIIQLSGGEPTIRNDLADIISLGRNLGFGFIQVNTNGLRLAADPFFVKQLAEAGLSSVYLQFDGMRDEIYRAIRGRELLAIKQAAVSNCARNSIGVVLVSTLVPGINDDNVGEILQFALAHSPYIRGVHFQPVSYFGRYPRMTGDKGRLTLPALMRSIEKQTAGLFKAAQFQPPNCENALCSFHCNYIILPDGRPQVLSAASGSNKCCAVQSEIDSRINRTVAAVTKQWRAPESVTCDNKQTITGQCCQCNQKTPDRVDPTPDRVDPAPGRVDPVNNLKTEPLDLDRFLDLVQTRSFTLSAMAFQDVWNIDLKRVKDCCIHTVSPEGRLIPFCVYNLTSSEGKPLYRERRHAKA